MGARRTRLTILLALAGVLVASSVRAGDFFDGFPDLPLMPGLSERPESAVVFDHATGQVATAVASGPVEPAAVRQFYRRTLPPLGWVPECAAPDCAPPDRYRRENQVLELELSPERGDTTARFLITR